LALRFHGRQFEWTFLLADVQQPILGADFLRFYKLVVDMDAGQLLDMANMQRFGPATVESRLLANVQATPPSGTFSRNFRTSATPVGNCQMLSMVWNTSWRPRAVQ
jgi:hypothetical protein